MVQCCKYVDDTSSPSRFLYSKDHGCKWEYSNWYGKSANCGYGYVMAGSCGSGGRKECPDRDVNGAYCCKLYNSAGKNICFYWFNISLPVYIGNSVPTKGYSINSVWTK